MRAQVPQEVWFELQLSRFVYEFADAAHMVATHVPEPPEELRHMELARLDMLQVAIWDKCMAGDIPAGNLYIRISKRRSELQGLDAPRRIDWRVSAARPRERRGGRRPHGQVQHGPPQRGHPHRRGQPRTRLS